MTLTVSIRGHRGSSTLTTYSNVPSVPCGTIACGLVAVVLLNQLSTVASCPLHKTLPPPEVGLPPKVAVPPSHTCWSLPAFARGPGVELTVTVSVLTQLAAVAVTAKRNDPSVPAGTET